MQTMWWISSSCPIGCRRERCGPHYPAGVWVGNEQGQCPRCWWASTFSFTVTLSQQSGGKIPLYDYDDYHCAFNPGNAIVRSLSWSERVDSKARRSPASSAGRSDGGTPCSLNNIGSERLFLTRKRGVMVIILVSLYLPCPSTQATPIWISWLFWLWFDNGSDRAVSADGASKLMAYK
jgi:hypothetical protein